MYDYNPPRTIQVQIYDQINFTASASNHWGGIERVMGR